jgi:hypothetical protein
MFDRRTQRGEPDHTARKIIARVNLLIVALPQAIRIDKSQQRQGFCVVISCGHCVATIAGINRIRTIVRQSLNCVDIPAAVNKRRPAAVLKIVLFFSACRPEETLDIKQCLIH